MIRTAFIGGGVAALIDLGRADAAVPQALDGGHALGKGKVLVLEQGSKGRVVIVDSTAYVHGNQMHPTDVVIVASYAGNVTLGDLFRHGVKAVIADDAGIGKDNAGISGLASAERFGIPAAAVDTRTAEMSNGRSLALGTISRANAPARALGVRPGQLAFEAAHLMLAQPTGKIVRIKSAAPPAVHLVDRTPKGRIFADTSSFDIFAKLGKLPDDVVCIGANSARVFGESILDIAPRGAIGNDCGMGKKNSAIAGLVMLESAGIAGAAVAAMSARIGDGMSTWHDGIISVANATAAGRGVNVGMPARQAARLML
jgi:hypothetical protein